MVWSEALKAEIKRRNPFATDEQIAALEAKWDKQNGGQSLTNQIARGVGTIAAKEAVKEGLEAAGASGASDLIPAAGNAYNAFDISKNDKMTWEEKQAAIQKEALMGVANFATLGLAGLGRSLGMMSGEGRKWDRTATKALKDYNKYYGNYNPYGPSFYLNLAGKLGAFGGLSTKAKQQRRAKELMDLGVTGYSEFYWLTEADRQLYEETYKDKLGDAGFRKDLPPDFIGFDPESGHWVNNVAAQNHNANLASFRPEDVWGSQGVFKTFGNDWLGKYKEADRRAISQKLIEAGLFRSDHGDMIITDPQKALALRDEYFGSAQGEPTFGLSDEEKEAQRVKEEEAAAVATTPKPNEAQQYMKISTLPGILRDESIKDTWKWNGKLGTSGNVGAKNPAAGWGITQPGGYIIDRNKINTLRG